MRRHHPSGNTVCRFRVNVIVVAFMSNILLQSLAWASFFCIATPKQLVRIAEIKPIISNGFGYGGGNQVIDALAGPDARPDLR